MFARHYSSVVDLLEVPSSLANKAQGDFHWHRVDRQLEKTWFGGISSRAHAKEVLLGGWPEGLKKIRETIGKVGLPELTSIRRKPVWRDGGDDLSMDRLYSGEADCWRTTERRSCPPGLVPCTKIMVSIGGGHKRPAEDFFWRGAAAVVLADALEESGRACEIIAYDLTMGLKFGGRKTDMDACLSVTLKRSDDPLDLSRLAAMTAHPAALRIAFFRANYAIPFKIRDHLGRAVTWINPPAPTDEPVIVIRDLFDEAATRKFLTETAGRI